MLLRSPERPAGARWQYSSSSRQPLPPPVGRAGLCARHHVMAMQSLGQAVHILDLRGKVLYWYGLICFLHFTVPVLRGKIRHVDLF